MEAVNYCMHKKQFSEQAPGIAYAGEGGQILIGDLQVGSVGSWHLLDEGNVLHFIAKQYFLNKFWMSGVDLGRVFTLRLAMGPVKFRFRGKFQARNFQFGRLVKGKLYLRSFEKLELISE